MQIKTLAQILAEQSDDVENIGDAKRSKRSVPKKNYRKEKTLDKNLSKKTPKSISENTQTGVDDSQFLKPNSKSRPYFTSQSSANKKPSSKRKFHPASVYHPKPFHQAQDSTPHNHFSKHTTITDTKTKTTRINSTENHSDSQFKCTSQDIKQLLLNRTQPSISKESLNPSTTINDSNTLQDPLKVENLPSALKTYLKSPEQRHAEKEAIKANSRLRWLAFYYLSRREYSANELREKLLDKSQDPVKIDELLAEFKEKGYQSDYRTALMLIREGIRKRRGRLRIKNDFYARKVAMPTNIDELIDMAMAENEAFVDVVSDNKMVEGVDWLRLAVEARVKKYGPDLPTQPKIKARQLRFLQYRGFKPEICFKALEHNLDTIENRF